MRERHVDNDLGARNRALFREVNDRIGQVSLSFDVDGHELYICECANPGCTEPMALTRAEYEAVREHANRFAVLPNHEDSATDTVVETHGHFSVVEPGTRNSPTAPARPLG